MSQRAEQFSCECGKQFSNRNDLDKHREGCATAQSTMAKSGSQQGGKVRGAGGSSNPEPGNS